ncbi:MAG: ABC transporter ATP-binding protein [Saprospiraceae bacterium]
MRIELEGVAKRFRMEWILRQVNLQMESGHSYAISGPNGSGKSTLLKILAGHLTPSRGKVAFSIGGNTLPKEEIYQHLCLAAPYIELIEEFTLKEALHFHQGFKPFLDGLGPQDIIQLLGLEKSTHKTVRDFSSGMRQRLKLALALCSQANILILDEPTSNLDAQGVEWYRALIDTYARDRLLIVASNVEVDFDFCEERIDVTQFKV